MTILAGKMNSGAGAGAGADLGIDQLAAAAWATVGYVAGKAGDRDALPDSSSYAVDLVLRGSIDGQPVGGHIVGRLNVGKGCDKASSVAPNVSHVIAAILGKLNAATRAKILADLPAEYAANGQALPDLSVGQVEQAEALLAALRSSKTVHSRGPVKCEYELLADSADDSGSLAAAG